MASAYAALVSLVHVLNRVQNPSCPASFDKLQIQSLFEKVHFLIDFLEGYSQRITGQDLKIKMVDAAFAAEDKIETYITDQVLERSSCNAYDTLLNDLEKITQEMDLIIQEVKNKNEIDQVMTRSNVDVVNSLERPVEMVKMVGFDNELTLLINQLTARQSSTRIIPIVGMGGIGKTTLARNVYNHPRLNNIFDVKAWVTISQEYNAGKIIRPLLRDIGIVDEIHDVELGDKLHKSLYGRKYLLILDDIWDTKAWDAISRFCPDNNKGSRILLTTRILDVARSVTSYPPFDIQLFDDDKSWKLLSRTVFENEGDCPLELEECGKKISKSCKGLPLAIAVIGGLLKTSDKTRKYWEDVAGNINSIISGEDGESCLNILSLSYHHLPIHLKPCFLYFATYPYDYKISVTKLISLWAADGCLKPSNVGDTSLEMVAVKYLADLVNRNLITVDTITSLGEMKFLTVHDLVMDLCIREVEKERFLHVDHGTEEFPGNERRVVFRGTRRRVTFPGSDCTSTQTNGFTRSFISLIDNSPGYISRLSLLRVFAVSVAFLDDTRDLRQLCNLRLVQLANQCRKGLLSNLSIMWNLETLIVDDGRPYLHSGILNLRHVKHIIFKAYFGFPDPPPALDARFAFQNLQTLECVENLTDKVLDMIPNIKRLVISHNYEISHGYDKLARCHKLETLKLVRTKGTNLMKMKFPNSLKKLHLKFTTIRQGCSFGSLPNLEVLKIYGSHFEDNAWNTVEGEFQSLKVLSISSDYLMSWTIDDCYPFPSLERLSLARMWCLEEIPEYLGESSTLESISLDDCSLPACISAKRILDLQQSQGNNDLTVKIAYDIPFFAGDKVEMRVSLEGMSSDNFHVTITEGKFWR